MAFQISEELSTKIKPCKPTKSQTEEHDLGKSHPGHPIYSDALGGFLRFTREEGITMTSESKRRFTDTEMQIARETDLPELLTHLGYQVKRIGRYHTAAEMDNLRIKDRRTWFR